MAIDRDSTRAAKARRRAQRRALRATSRGVPNPASFHRMAAQPPDDSGGAGEPVESLPPAEPPMGTWEKPELPGHFITADDLSEQETEASALQAELAAVRELLDRELLDPSLTAPPTPPEAYAEDLDSHLGAGTGRPMRPGRSRTRGVVLTLFVLIFVIGLVLAALAVSGSGPFASASDTPVTITRPSPAASASTQIRGLPTAGPGIDQAGAAMGIQVLADQSIAVTEQAVLDDAGLANFQLALPALKGLTGDAAKLEPAIDDLKITINGEPATVSQTDDQTWMVVSPAGPAREVRLTYRLTGAVVISQPSSAGRALALVTPLLAQLLHEGGEPVELRIPVDGVSNVICIGAAQAESLCGAERDMTWSVTIPDDANSAAVLLQLNLR